jgi:hypothetical protein
MLISELIDQVTKLKNEFGDVKVYVVDSNLKLMLLNTAMYGIFQEGKIYIALFNKEQTVKNADFRLTC